MPARWCTGRRPIRITTCACTAGAFAAAGALSKADGFYRGWLVQIAPTATSPLAGQARLVAGYDGASQTFTLAGGFTAAPAAGDPLLIFPLVTASVRLDFYEPLPDDGYTLTVFDTLRDPAGNLLDGENNAAEPQEDPSYPTGDGLAGMDFVARFTVDSRPEVGTICCGAVYVDSNGNFAFDPEGQDGDYTNEDLVLLLGETTDARFAGNFAAAGATAASGFDKLGAYGRVGNAYRFLLDLDHDGVFDVSTVSGLQLPALPILGNFDPPKAGSRSNLAGHTNPENRLDVNGDGLVTALDGLLLINDQNTNGSRPLELRVANVAPFLDVSGDLWATPEDVLDVGKGMQGRGME